MVKASIKKSDLILLLLNGDNKFPIDGITRFEKLIFLTQKEILDKWDDAIMKFNFEPDRFGPLATEIYDEIDFLKSVEMIKEGIGKKYEITDKGKRFLEMKTYERVNEDIRKRISDLKEKHGREKLDVLLRYVYSNYPDFTVKSEIRDKVLS